MDPDALADALLARTLPREAWTHDGHVTAGWALCRRLGAAQTLATLREAIPAYNVSVGGENTDDEGYHDTLTVYYVWAIGRLAAAGNPLDAVLADPSVTRDAPRRHWTRELLFSVAARRGWVEPDLEPGPALPV